MKIELTDKEIALLKMLLRIDSGALGLTYGQGETMPGLSKKLRKTNDAGIKQELDLGAASDWVH